MKPLPFFGLAAAFLLSWPAQAVATGPGGFTEPSPRVSFAHGGEVIAATGSPTTRATALIAGDGAVSVIEDHAKTRPLRLRRLPRDVTARDVRGAASTGTDGTRVVAWTIGREVFAAIAPPGGGFARATIVGAISQGRTMSASPVLAVLSDGGAAVAWEDGPTTGEPGDGAITVIRRPAGGTWGTATEVTSAGSTQRHLIGLQADGRGGAALAWQERTSGQFVTKLTALAPGTADVASAEAAPTPAATDALAVQPDGTALLASGEAIHRRAADGTWSAGPNPLFGQPTTLTTSADGGILAVTDAADLAIADAAPSAPFGPLLRLGPSPTGGGLPAVRRWPGGDAAIVDVAGNDELGVPFAVVAVRGEDSRFGAPAIATADAMTVPSFGASGAVTLWSTVGGRIYTLRRPGGPDLRRPGLARFTASRTFERNRRQIGLFVQADESAQIAVRMSVSSGGRRWHPHARRSFSRPELWGGSRRVPPFAETTVQLRVPAHAGCRVTVSAEIRLRDAAGRRSVIHRKWRASCHRDRDTGGDEA